MTPGDEKKQTATDQAVLARIPGAMKSLPTWMRHKPFIPPELRSGRGHLNSSFPQVLLAVVPLARGLRVLERCKTPHPLLVGAVSVALFGLGFGSQAHAVIVSGASDNHILTALCMIESIRAIHHGFHAFPIIFYDLGLRYWHAAVHQFLGRVAASADVTHHAPQLVSAVAALSRRSCCSRRMCWFAPLTTANTRLTTTSTLMRVSMPGSRLSFWSWRDTPTRQSSGTASARELHPTLPSSPRLTPARLSFVCSH